MKNYRDVTELQLAKFAPKLILFASKQTMRWSTENRNANMQNLQVENYRRRRKLHKEKLSPNGFTVVEELIMSR